MRSDLERNLRETLPIPLSDEDVHEILSAFMTSFTGCADELRGLADGTDFTAIRRVTHALKGFSANVGAHDLNALALTLNAAAHAEDSAACASHIRDILDLHARYAADLTP